LPQSTVGRPSGDGRDLLLTEHRMPVERAVRHRYLLVPRRRTAASRSGRPPAVFPELWRRGLTDGGETTGRNPTDRGKQGPKRSMLTEASGIPAGVAVAGANRDDVMLLAATLASIPVPRQRGASRRASVSARATTSRGFTAPHRCQLHATRARDLRGGHRAPARDPRTQSWINCWRETRGGGIFFLRSCRAISQIYGLVSGAQINS
jgi:hypothetical protein